MRRIAIRIVVCLGLGAISSVGMALWIAALWGQDAGERRWMDAAAAPRDAARAVRMRAFGVEIVRIYFGDRTLDRQNARGGVWRRDPGDPAKELWLTPWWARFVDPDTRTALPGHRGIATGWPVACLCAWVTYDYERGDWRIVGGWSATGAKEATQFERGVIPLTPAWRGLTIDAAAHGLWWFVVASAMSRTKRRRTRVGRAQSIAMTLRWCAMGGALGLATTLVIAMTPPFVVRTVKQGQSGGFQSLFLSRVGPLTAIPIAPPQWPTTDRTGLPFRCFSAEWQSKAPVLAMSGHSVATIKWGVVLADGKEMERVRVLPLRPAWSALAFNVVLFSAAWMLVVPVVAMGMDRLRKARGLCPCCGYDLKHDFAAGCPECGWGREGKA